jgi:hypothetical protein
MYSMVSKILSMTPVASSYMPTSRHAGVSGSTAMRFISRSTASCTPIYSKVLQCGAYIEWGFCIYRFLGTFYALSMAVFMPKLPAASGLLVTRRTASVRGVLVFRLSRASAAHIGEQGTRPAHQFTLPAMRSLKLSHLERALVRKLFARRYTVATLTRMFRCCQTTVNRAVRNHMGDDVEDDDAIIRDAELPADVSVMLGLKGCDDDSAPPVADRWRPWAPTRGVVVPRTPARAPQPFPRLVARRSPKVCVGHLSSPSSRIPRIVLR